MSDDLACQAFTYYVPGFQPLRWNITLAQVICDQIPGILIDGNSRCKRAYDDGRPFFVRLLSDRAAQACLIDGPKELLPWES